jgi:hypothetical protein
MAAARGVPTILRAAGLVRVDQAHDSFHPQITQIFAD